MLKLPFDAEELAAALTRPLAGRAALETLTVRSVSLKQPDGPDLTAKLVLEVVAAPASKTSAQRWHVEIPVSPDDLDPGVKRQALILTLRANLEEWWDTMAFDSHTKAWGVLSDDDEELD